MGTNCKVGTRWTAEGYFEFYNPATGAAILTIETERIVNHERIANNSASTTTAGE